MAQQFYFEFVELGPQLRVAALDAESGEEIVFIAPAGAPREMLKRFAARRMQHHLGLLSAKAPPSGNRRTTR